MHKAQWIAKKNYLGTLIKKVSDGWGGDDIEWLKDYFRELIEKYPDDRINEAILCFVDLVEQLKYVPCRT